MKLVKHLCITTWTITSLYGFDAKQLQTFLTTKQGAGADLSNADLSYKNLDGANLAGANISGANFSYASLQGANVSGVNAQGSNFCYANMTGVNASNADFSALITTTQTTETVPETQAGKKRTRSSAQTQPKMVTKTKTSTTKSISRLSYAKLTGATLTGTKFTDADLNYADCSQCTWGNAVVGQFANATALHASFKDPNPSTFEPTNIKYGYETSMIAK